MAAAKPRIKVQKTAAKGEIVTIKTLISHPMESGQRKDAQGNTIPRKIINSFRCTFNGRPVFAMEIAPAVSANPYIEFAARVEESGTFAFLWVDDDGTEITAEEAITVA